MLDLSLPSCLGLEPHTVERSCFACMPTHRAYTRPVVHAAGDRIVGVNGTHVNGLAHGEILELIKQTPPASPLRLVAVHDGVWPARLLD